MIARGAGAYVAGSRRLETQRRWPASSATRDRQAATGALDLAVHNVVRGADLLDEMLCVVPVQRRVARSILTLRHEQGRLRHDLAALSARRALGIDAGALNRAASTMDELVEVTEQIADLHVAYGIQEASKPSRSSPACCWT